MSENYYRQGPKKGLLKDKYMVTWWHEAMSGTVHYSGNDIPFMATWNSKKKHGQWIAIERDSSGHWVPIKKNNTKTPSTKKSKKNARS